MATTEVLPTVGTTAPAADNTLAQPRTSGVRPQHAD
jgi:hypothetical protein